MERLVVPGILESLGTIAQYVQAVAARAGLSKQATYRLRQAVDEIVTNIILHGYQAVNREGALELQADIDSQSLRISIEDTGIAYDPRLTEPPSQEELQLPMEERQLGGLGIYIAMQNVDELIYQGVGDRNRNTLVVYLDRKSKLNR